MKQARLNKQIIGKRSFDSTEAQRLGKISTIKLEPTTFVFAKLSFSFRIRPIENSTNETNTKTFQSEINE